MRIPVERKIQLLAAKKHELDTFNEIEDGAEKLGEQLEYNRRVMIARKHRAASRIQGLIKGFLSRLLAAQLRLEYKCTLVIQSLVRGFLGRKRWMYEYWKKISVVKSKQGLADLLERSTLTRDSKGQGAGSGWREYFDSLTNSFWYFDPKTRLNTWVCPLAFQKELVCTWNGFQEYGGLPSQPKCRCVFDSTTSYQNHMRLQHRWYCPACDTANRFVKHPKNIQ